MVSCFLEAWCVENLQNAITSSQWKGLSWARLCEELIFCSSLSLCTVSKRWMATVRRNCEFFPHSVSTCTFILFLVLYYLFIYFIIIFLGLCEQFVTFVQGGKSYQYLLRDIYEDLITRLVDLSSKESILSLQPCRDNTFYLLKLVDEMLVSELDNKLPVCSYPCSPSINLHFQKQCDC